MVITDTIHVETLHKPGTWRELRSVARFLEFAPSTPCPVAHSPLVVFWRPGGLQPPEPLLEGSGEGRGHSQRGGCGRP